MESPTSRPRPNTYIVFQVKQSSLVKYEAGAQPSTRLQISGATNGDFAHVECGLMCALRESCTRRTPASYRQLGQACTTGCRFRDKAVAVSYDAHSKQQWRSRFQHRSCASCYHSSWQQTMRHVRASALR